MFYFNFPEHIVELHSGKTTTRTKKLNWCSRNIKYCTSVDMYRTITRLNISKQMQTFTRGTSLRFGKSSSVPAQLIFLEYKCWTSKVWFTQRRTHNYSLHTYGKYAFSFPHIIAFDSYFHPIIWGADVTLTAKVRTTGGDVSCPVGDPGGGRQDSNQVPFFFTILLVGALLSLCEFQSPGKDITIQHPTKELG